MKVHTDQHKHGHQEHPSHIKKVNSEAGAEVHEVHPFLSLQRTIGNQAVQRLVQARQAAQAEPVMPVEPALQAQIESQKSHGRPLSPVLQAEMEQAVGGDLSGIQLHTDSQSAHLARSLQADAFTQGRDVFFAEGAFDPAAPRTRETLVHELTHVAEGRTATGSVQRQPKQATEPKGAKEPDEIQMPPDYMRPMPPDYINPTYGSAQTLLSRYFEFERGLAQLLIEMRDTGFKSFKEASDAEYNKKEASTLLKLFEFALTAIPVAGGLLTTFKMLTGGGLLGKAAEAAKDVSEAKEVVSTGEKVVKTTESIKGVVETGKAGKELVAPEPEAKAKGDFSMQVIRDLAEMRVEAFSGAWNDEINLDRKLQNLRREPPNVDLENNIRALLETLYGPMVVPGKEVVTEVAEEFELELYQDFWVEERHAFHLYEEGNFGGGDKGIQVMPEGVQKRIEKLKGWGKLKNP